MSSVSASKHAPLPWRFDSVRSIIKASKYEIAALHAGVSDEETENGEFICRAVNSHYELLEACRWAYASICRVEGTESEYRFIAPLTGAEMLRKAIDKATGGQL